MFKKYINYKYRAKLRYRQPDLIWYFSFTIIGIGCLLFIKFLNNFLYQINSEYRVSNTLFVFILITLFLVNMYLLYLSPISFSRNQRIKNKLLQIIEQNNFYYEVNGRIRSSMLMVFYDLNDELHIEVYPLGGKYTFKIDELGKLFETKLNMNLVTIKNDYADHTTYVLSNESNLALNANDLLR